MNELAAFIIWCYIGAGSTIVLMPMIGDRHDFLLIWHMFKHHDIVSKIIVGSKFAGIFLLLSLGGPLTTIFLTVIYFKQKDYQ